MSFNVLSVDELGITAIELSNMLQDISVKIINVKDEVEMLKVLLERKVEFHAITWTINSMDLKDFEAIDRLKSKEAYKGLPVVIISRFTDKKYIIRAIECGAVEYIAKPYDEAAVVRKMCKVLGVSLGESASGKMDEDIMTYNFSEMFNKEIKAASRGTYPLTIMMLSVSGVPIQPLEKDVESVLALMSRVIRTKLRETDSTFQYGGNKLVLLLPFADKSSSEIVENKLKGIIAAHSMTKERINGGKLVTASITFPDDGKIKGKLLEKLEMKLDAALKAAESAEG